MKPARRDLSVLVLGATGYTGRLVAHELARQGTPFGIAGRSARRLSDLGKELRLPVPQIVVPEGDSAALTDALQMARSVIACAGPFGEIGAPVVEAAIASGTHYLDITGEQEFVRRCTERDKQAGAAGVCIVPSMAFEVALADMGAALAAERLGTTEEVIVTYRIRAAASRGTQRSALRILREPGFVLEDGEWVDAGAAPPTHRARFADGRTVTAVRIPGAEIVTVPRQLHVRRVRAYMALGGFVGWVAPWVLPRAPALMKGRLGGLLKSWIDAKPPSSGPSDEERPHHRFTILIEARGGGQEARVEVAGRDPYGLTAVIAARAARRMTAAGYACKGVRSPASAFPAREFLAELADAGVSFSIS